MPMNERPLSRLAATCHALAGVLLVAGCSTQPPAAPPPASAGLMPESCASLKGTQVEAAQIAWPGQTSGPATVTEATWHVASERTVAERGPTPAALITPAMPAHCRVVGRIAAVRADAEPIQFQVNLPQRWNGRSVQFGGGGFNGVLITGLGLVPGARYDAPAPLMQGYVTAGTDSGHTTKPNQPPMTFALNDEMLVNFAHAAYPKVRNVSVALMQRVYGKPPAKLYFVGSSEGGREGLTLAQRYPAAFDGIFSRVPVIHWTGLQFAGARNGMALMGEGWLNPEQVKLVHEATLRGCDTLDGAADRIIGNVATCLSVFNPQTLLCKPGAAPGTCLNEAQVKAVQTLRSPYRFPFALANGLTQYPGWGVGGEDTTAYGPTGGWRAWWTGNAAPVVPPVQANGIAWFYGSGALQYFYARDPKADPRTITPQSTAERVREISALMDSTNPDLSAFHARGGKLIVLEHLSDYAQSPMAGIEYVQAVEQRLGPARTTSFLRLYAAPGVDHVGSGAPALVDMLGTLSAWVEKGLAPGAQEVAEQEVKAPFGVQRTRPLCEWPLFARYKGSGDLNQARSYECSR